MRAFHAGILVVFVVGAAASCLLTSSLDDLEGGAPKPTDSGVGVDTGEACDPTLCNANPIVVSLTDIAPCTTETTDKAGCRKKIHDVCLAKDPCCAHGGFGPIDFPNPTQATIVCLPGSTYTVSWSEVTSKAPGCSSISQAGTHVCDMGVHQSAITRAHATGIFQVANADGTAIILGLSDTQIIIADTVTWTDLSTAVSGCTQPNVDKQACTTAAHRVCSATTFGFNTTSGYGPVVFSTTSPNVTLACVF